MGPKCSACGGESDALVGLATFNAHGGPPSTTQAFMLRDEGCQFDLCLGCVRLLLTKWNAGDLLPKEDP